jgi:hypothetical protein
MSHYDRYVLVAEQIDWLRLVGFVNVDVHWMKAGHAIFSGSAPS